MLLLWQVPKLLLHRLFPNARYSLWVDAKLELVVDPILILERYICSADVAVLTLVLRYLCCDAKAIAYWDTYRYYMTAHQFLMCLLMVLLICIATYLGI